MDKLKKKKMLILMIVLAVVAGLALCYITDWSKGKPANYQCEEKQCVKNPTSAEPANTPGPTVSFFGFQVSVNVVIAAVIIFFITLFVLFCYAWYTANWRLTLFLFVLFFLFCIFMRQFLPAT